MPVVKNTIKERDTLMIAYSDKGVNCLYMFIYGNEEIAVHIQCATETVNHYNIYLYLYIHFYIMSLPRVEVIIIIITHSIRERA